MVDFFTPEIKDQTEGLDERAAQDEAPFYTPSGTLERLGQDVSSEWTHDERLAYGLAEKAGQLPAPVKDFLGAVSPGAQGIFEAGDLLNQQEKVAPKDLQAKFPGVKGLDEPLPLSVATSIAADEHAQETRASIAARYPSGIGHAAQGLGVDLMAGLLDPVQDAAFMVPVVGEARYATWLVRAGEAAGTFGRAGVTLGVGGLRGAAGQQVLTGLDYAAGDDDMTLGDAAVATLQTAGLGALFHGATSFRGDILGRRFAEHAGEIPAATDDAAGRAAAAQMATGQPVEVRSFFRSKSDLLGSTALDSTMSRFAASNETAKSNEHLDDAVARAAGAPSQTETRLENEAKTAQRTPPEQVVSGEMAEAQRDIQEMRSKGQLTDEDEQMLASLEAEQRDIVSHETSPTKEAEAPAPEKGFRTTPAKIQEEHDLEVARLSREGAEAAVPKHEGTVPPIERRGQPRGEAPVGEATLPREHAPDALRESIASDGSVKVGDKSFGVKSTKAGWVTTETDVAGGREFTVTKGPGLVAQSRGQALDEAAGAAAAHAKEIAPPLEEPKRKVRLGFEQDFEGGRPVGDERHYFYLDHSAGTQLTNSYPSEEALRTAHPDFSAEERGLEPRASEAQDVQEPAEGSVDAGGTGGLREEGGKPPADVSPEAVRPGEEGRLAGQPGEEPVGGDRGLGEQPAAQGRGSEEPQPAGEGEQAEAGADVRRERRIEGIVAPGRGDGEADRPDGRVRGQDFRILADGLKPPKTPKGRIAANLRAIETLKELEATEAPATREQQEALSGFVGWGGAHQIFDPKNTTFTAEKARLLELLTADQIERARASTINAHYTSPEIARALWGGLDALGFKGDGVVLEPGMGVGTFLGTRPEGVEPRFTGVELDDITGKIARALYPQARIHINGFEKTRLPENSYDAVIGNVPFSDVRPNDKLYNKARALSLHNYFIVKSLHLLKPGGVMGVISTHYTLDAAVPHAREAMRDAGGDLLGAVRLPSTAFKANAGTEVVTDILFFRKRLPGETPKEDWIKSEPMSIGASSARVNRYFHDHPEDVLGAHSMTGSMYGAKEEYTVTGDAARLGARVRERAQEIADRGPKFEANPSGLTTFDERQPEPPGMVKDGSFFVAGNKIMQQQPLGAVEADIPKSKMAMAKGFIAIRDAARGVLAAQRADWDGKGTPPWADAQKRLNDAYDAFVAKHGPLNKVETSERTMPDGEVRKYRRYPNLRAFRDDPDVYLVSAVETFDEDSGKAGKAPIMSRRVLEPEKRIEHVNTPEEALIASMNQKGSVDLPYMEKVLGKPSEEIVSALPGRIFEDPDSGGYETAERYLSGDVRAKLLAAQAAGLKQNIAALEAVQPKDLEPSEIDVRLGAPWIPHTDIEEFIDHLLELNARVVHIAKDATWRVELSAGRNAIKNLQEWGVSGATAHEMIEDALNQRSTTIMVRQADGSMRTDVNRTIVAQEKQQQIKEKFAAWVWDDHERSQRLARFYNDNFNNLRVPEYNGDHLTLPGTSAAVHLRSTQKKAIWRYLVSGNTLLDHVVGAGKTYTGIGAAMEAKRIGLHKKPMFAVPNHMLEQFSREFLQLYPSARILVANKDDITRNARRAFVAKAAAGDWDAIIMTHSGFEKVPLSQERQARFVRDEIVQYEDMIRQSMGDRLTVKILEAAKKRREEKLKALLEAKEKDEGLSFEDTGADALFVDEAHLFKNLEFPTKIQGMQSVTSQRAFDLFAKTRYIDGMTPGRGLMFMTGTPISNSMAEMFTMQRYLAHQALAERNIAHFDAWAAQFGDAVTKPEIAPDGLTARLKTRFAKFRNIPELVSMYRQFADLVTKEDIGKDVDLPKIQGGKAETVQVPASEALLSYVRNLAERAEAVKQRAVTPEVDNMLKISNDGRNAALDMRLVGGEKEPDRKAVTVAKDVHQIWEETKANRLTQLVFLDRSTPKEDRFNAYDDIRNLLIGHGVTPEDIAFIHHADTDEKKARLFADVRAGRKRILLGSTDKMGIGTNVQDRLFALHNVDAPWRPSDIEQRTGRGERQGNRNPSIRVRNYVTTGSFDAYMWQTLERKARFINQIKRGDPTQRSAEDIDDNALSYAEVKALASGNPLIMKKAEADAAAETLARVRSAHFNQQTKLEWALKSIPARRKAFAANLADAEADAARLDLGKGDTFSMKVDNETFKKRADAGNALGETIRRAVDVVNAKGAVTDAVSWPVVHLGGFDVSVEAHAGEQPRLAVRQRGGTHFVDIDAGAAGLGALTRLENYLRSIPGEAKMLQGRMSDLDKEEKQTAALVGRPFDREAEYHQAIARQQHIDDLLGVNGDEAKTEAEKRGAPEKQARAQTNGWDETYTGAKYDKPAGEQRELAPGLKATLPTNPLDWEREIIGGVDKIAKRIVPTAHVVAARRIISEGEFAEASGQGKAAAVSGAVSRDLVAWSLDSANPEWAMRHEAVHFLRGAGLFKPEEWRTLETAAGENGWHERFQIDTRYPEAPDWLKTEESIAEAFGQWRQNQELPWVPEIVRPLFERIQSFFGQVGDYLRRLFGKDATANDIFSRIESGEIGRRPPGDFSGAPRTAASVPMKRDDVEKQKAIMVKRHLTTMMDIRKRQALTDRIDGYRKQGLSIARSIDALTRGISQSVKGARDSTAQEQLARQNDFLGRLQFSLDKIPGAMEAWRSRTHTAEWVRELAEMNKKDGKPGLTKSPMALKIAQAVKDAQDLAQYHLNKAGAWIGDYDGYVSRTRHNAITIDRAGFEAWRAYTLERLDQDRTFEDIENDADLDTSDKQVAIDRFLKNVWDALSTGVHISSQSGVSKNAAFIGTPNIARRVSAERVLHWKDADAWREYQERFGDPAIERGVMDGLWRAGRDTALMGRWGSNPLYTFENMLRQARVQYRDDHAAIADFAKSEKRLREEFAYLTGEATRPGNSLAWRVRSNILAWQDITKLPFVLFTHLSVGATKPFQLKYSGVGRWQAYTSVLRNLAQDRSPEGHQILENLRANATGQARTIMSGYEPIDGVPGQVAKLRMLSMRMGGLPWMLGRQKAGTEWELSNFLGQRIEQKFEALPAPTQRVLKIYGIEAPEWDALRLAPDHDTDGQGSTYLTPAAAGRTADAQINALIGDRMAQARDVEDADRMRADARDRLAMKLAGYYSDAAERSTVTPGIPERALLSLHAGRFAGPIIGQYKTWAMAAARQMWGQAIYGSSKGEALTALAELVAVGTAMGYARMVVTDTLKGKEPRFFTGEAKHDIKIIGAAMAQGGGLGIFGDYLFGEFDRFGRSFGESLAGPAVGDVSDFLKVIYGLAHAPMEDEPEHAFHEASAEGVRFLINHLPIVNAFYIRRIADWLILDRLQEMASPGYLKRYQDRVKKQTGQGFWLPPSQYAGAPNQGAGQ